MLNPRFDVRSPMPYIWNTALGLHKSVPQFANPNIQNADYYFHKQIVDSFVNGLRAAGAIIITEVDLISVTGLTARADFMGMLPAFGGIVMTEVKTSLTLNDYDEFPTLPRFQGAVYRLVTLGGHVASPNLKITQIGLTPNKPFPPMRFDLIKAIPGQLYDIQSFAPGIPIPPDVL